MSWFHDVAYFFGGVLLANAIPHFVSGVMGRPFQSPFAHPPGKGMSSATVNVWWGFANLVVAYLLLARVGSFDIHATDHAAAAGLGLLVMGLMAAHLFGPLHGGRLPRER